MARIISLTAAVVLSFLLMQTALAQSPSAPPAGPLDFTVQNIDGQATDLSQFKGKVVMIVNVASKCGFTPQYAGLESLYEKYKDQGFVIIGFPANNFHSQEPGTNLEIKTFCTGKYNVTFPMMAKISVKGDDKAPIYKYLTETPKGGIPGEITWNFNKFLIGRDGQVIARFPSNVKPDGAVVIGAVEGAIK
jgi:glutathione peroxidase